MERDDDNVGSMTEHEIWNNGFWTWFEDDENDFPVERPANEKIEVEVGEKETQSRRSRKLIMKLETWAEIGYDLENRG